MLAKIEADKAGYEEGILLDDARHGLRGHGREPVRRQGRRDRHAGLRRPTILGGINRLSAIQIARDLGYEVVERDIARGELYLADEIFMTGTAAELTPLREIDDHAVGDGRARRDHARRSSASSRTRCTAAPSATPTGSTWCRRPRPRRDGAVVVYDCTLRDGMQGEGMSLSAEEKLRVAHLLDDLGVHMIEAGFPASNPKEAELFALLARERFARRGRGVRDDAAARRRAPTRTRRCGCWPTRFAPVCTLVGKTWGAAPREGRARRPRREPAHDRGLRRLPRRRGQDASSTTPSTSSTAGRRPGLRAALRAGGRGGGRRVRHAVRHQRRARCPHEIEAATAAVRRRARRRAVGIHCHNDAACGVANSLAAVRAGRDAWCRAR